MLRLWKDTVNTEREIQECGKGRLKKERGMFCPFLFFQNIKYFIFSHYKYLEMREDYSLNHFKTLQIISSTLMGLHIFISLKAYLYHMPSNQQPTSCLLHKDFSKCLLNIFSLPSLISTAKQGKNNLIFKRILSVFFSYKIISFFTIHKQITSKEIKSKNNKKKSNLSLFFPYKVHLSCTII